VDPPVLNKVVLTAALGKGVHKELKYQYCDEKETKISLFVKEKSQTSQISDKGKH
jgi:hypothetical protein